MALAAPSTNWVDAPETVPRTGFEKIVAGGTGNAGRPVRLAAATGPPVFRPKMSAIRVVDWFTRIGLGLALWRSCSHRSTGAPATSFAPGPRLAPHQLSAALTAPPVFQRALPCAGIPAVFRAKREKAMLIAPVAVLALTIAPPPVAAWFPTKCERVMATAPIGPWIKTAPPSVEVDELPVKVELATVRLEGLLPPSKRTAPPPPPAVLTSKVEPVMVRVPSTFETAPPGAAGDWLSVNRQLAIVVWLPVDPLMTPPPPVPVVSRPPRIVTPDTLNTKPEERPGLTSSTRSFGCVCWMMVVAAPAPTMLTSLAVTSRSPMELSPRGFSPAPPGIVNP